MARDVLCTLLHVEVQQPAAGQPGDMISEQLKRGYDGHNAYGEARPSACVMVG